MNTPVGNVLLETHHLGVEIAGKIVCRELGITLHGGEVLGLLGPNGVGKTTLLHTLAGVRPPVQGEIHIAGKELTAWPRRQLAQRLGLLLQEQQDMFPASVLETALIGRHPHMDFWRWESHRDVAIARRALKTVHLQGLEQRPQYALSGGERRRMTLATILSQTPDIYLLDEPVNHLDLRHQLSILQHFRQLADKQRKAIVMTLHDINLVARYCDTALLLYGDGAALHGPVDRVLTEENLSRLYNTPVIKISADGRTAFLT